MPPRAISQEITEFEFHISPASSSSRPQTGRGHLGDELEEAPRERRVVRQALGTVDRLVHVRDDSATPAPDLVAKEPQPAEATAADCAFGDDAS